MNGIISWLTALPLAVLYPVMALFAAVENVFPPVPADTVVALGSWLAARGSGSVLAAFAATWVGNVAGAAAMYFVGRRHGAGWMQQRFPRLADGSGTARLEKMYATYGIPALIVSRFIPGLRALVPPVAGALHVPPAAALGAIAIASGAWYGFISYIAFSAGQDWTHLTALVRRSGLIVAAVAAALVAIALAVWFIRRQKHGTG